MIYKPEQAGRFSPSYLLDALLPETQLHKKSLATAKRGRVTPVPELGAIRARLPDATRVPSSASTARSRLYEPATARGVRLQRGARQLEIGSRD